MCLVYLGEGVVFCIVLYNAFLQITLVQIQLVFFLSFVGGNDAAL